MAGSPASDGSSDEAVAAFHAALNAKTTTPAADEPLGTIAAGLIADVASTAAIDAESPGEERPIALADIQLPVEDSPPLAPEAGDGTSPPAETAAIDNGRNDVETAAARRRALAAERRRRERRRVRLPAIILTLLAVCAALLAWRKDIVRHVPQLASFYSSVGLPVNLRGLAFDNVKIGNEMHDAVPILTIEGMIVSTVSKPVEVPRLRFALRNAAGIEVYAWTALPSQSILEPGAALPFRSRLASPPADGHDVRVRFFTHRDAVDGSR